MEEGGGDCFDALGELRPLAGDEGVDELHSGATQEIDHDDEIGAKKDDRLEKGEDVEQQLHAAEEVEVNRAVDIPEVESTGASPAKQGIKGISVMEVEQPSPTAEKVEENLVTSTPEVEKVDMDHATQETENSVAVEVEENPDVIVNPTEGVETGPIEGVETNFNVPEKEEIVILTDGEEEAEKVPPSVEAIKPEAAAVRTYQRRPAREETSEKRSEGELPRETPGQGAAGAPPCKQRLLLDEEPEEKDDVFFLPIGDQHSLRQPDVWGG